MAKPTPLMLRINHLADFKPTAMSRAWVSIPNPNDIPLIATATSEKSVRVYSLRNFTLHSKMDKAHERTVKSVAWKPTTGKGRTKMSLATGSFDSTMGIWQRREQFGGEVASNSMDGEDQEMEITSSGKPKSHRNTDGSDAESESSGEEEWEYSIVLEGHDSEIKCVSYSPSGQYLASCSRDKSIWVWEEIGEDGDDEWETVAVLQEHEADVKCVAWRKDDGNGELLASGSYDDTVRLWRGDEDGEWSSVAALEGHEGTVWALEWEPEAVQKLFANSTGQDDGDEYSRPPKRLMSSSADLTIRVWSKTPTPPPPNRPSYFSNAGIPSTMRPGPNMETWTCSATLPTAHTLPIYSISWSPLSGRVCSTSSDGFIVVYEERTTGRTSVGGAIEREWVVIGVLEGAHGPYEVNHVTWAKRYDPGSRPNEEMIITTGDDGAVRAWFITDIPQAGVESGIGEITIS
ncbi:putative cytosolic iron-sulfur protein assembly protein 1 [Amylocarpus encephaloides]|uniref:Probable cytosolic iron-sulfur protein assembly protein 1 n=1 Tax=Amylocarpus encephaloides TaxID=45428 RepID=A0A9P7YUY9_9HELO|nr:putative cytosolic iron-sulfur protein assembly protein 1 [Amylocarpus encephaloides]